MTNMKNEVIADFATKLKGQLLQPGDASYDEARKIWNAMIDRRPGLIVRAAGVSDVRRAVAFARDHSLLLAVKGGGHNIAGNALCDDGLMIDLSQMNVAWVDPDKRRAYVEGGATLADFDHEAQAYGLATPLGINSTTGVAGLTLGGGFGWLSRKYGLTVDNLLSAEIITADAERLLVSADSHPELFWAIRGGGGNFGVVTMFEFQLHPVGPDIVSGLIVFPFEQAKAILTQYRDLVNNIPDDLSIWAVMRRAPPLPFLPPEVHGKDVVVLAIFSTMSPEDTERAIAPVRGFGNACGEHMGVQPYVSWQKAFDPLLTPGARNYWKSHNFATLSNEAIDAVIQYAGKLPSDESEIFLGLLGGQANRQAPDATAYPHRNVLFAMNVHTRWSEPADDKRCITWAREFFAASAPFAAGSVYINFLTQDEGERISEAYGKNFDRLVEAKNKYDPRNLFRQNQNIKPTVQAS